jgi:hypothetical protein
MKNKQEIIQKLQELLDDCMSMANQEGLVIKDIDFNDDNEESGVGTIKFNWCECENEPYFVGY